MHWVTGREGERVACAYGCVIVVHGSESSATWIVSRPQRVGGFSGRVTRFRKRSALALAKRFALEAAREMGAK